MSENVGASTSRNPKGLHGLYGDNFTFTHERNKTNSGPHESKTGTPEGLQPNVHSTHPPSVGNGVSSRNCLSVDDIWTLILKLAISWTLKETVHPSDVKKPKVSL
jgi:hypothetical protein